MASAAADYKIEEISSKLLARLASQNQSFDRRAYLQRFRALESNAAKIDFLYKKLQKYDLFPKFIKTNKKNDAEAIEIREDGNELFAMGLYNAAFVLFTRSIAVAKTARIASLAYGNRSACLFRMDKFEECLKDIELAFQHDYPEKLTQKLVARRNNAKKMPTNKRLFHDPVPEIPNSRKHNLIQCARDCITIKTNKKFGRHIVASKNIRIGEVISVENPYVAVLEECKDMHCNACMTLCYNLIPCDSCTCCLFCSVDCKEKAQHTYHKMECGIVHLFAIYRFPSYMLLALRATLMAADDYDHLDSLRIKPEENYRSDRYREIYNLMSGINDCPVEKLYDLAVKAAVICNFVQQTKFFMGPKSDLKKKVFKELILKHLATVILNAQNIYENVNTIFGSTSRVLGFGLYSFTSLFNHSCARNVEMIQYGSTMVLRALNQINEGQQCFVSYGMQYDDTGKSRRQMILKSSFLFNCRCEACEENWRPSLDPIPLHLDLRMSTFETSIMKTNLLLNNVSVARDYLRHLVHRWYFHYNSEPLGNTTEMKQLLSKCFTLLGNSHF